MLQQFFNWKAQSSREWKVLITFEVFVSSVILYASYILSSQTTAKLQTNGVNVDVKIWIPDLVFGYTSSSLHELMDTFGAEGRRLYLGIEIWDSFVYSFGYAFILASSMQWCASVLMPNNNKNKVMNRMDGGGTRTSTRTSTSNPLLSMMTWLPWLPWLVDLLENTAHVYCIMMFDEEGMDKMWAVVANIGSYATMTKWSSFAFNVLLIVIMVVWKKRFSPKMLVSKQE